ncbi:MAG: S-layer homology domain-containing protein [Evtepia sp.]
MGRERETRGKTQRYTLKTKTSPQKKVLSLVLCVAMLLSVMVMGTGAAFTDEDDFSPQYAEAAEVLTGMKVMQGYDDGSFLPQRNITRAQVATLIYRAVTGDVNDTQTGLYTDWDKFDDVQADDWFAGYVNYCANGELIKGFTPDTFGPNKNVTGYQVLAMILRAVGYDQNDEFTGTNWTINVASTAMQEGLLKNVDGSVDLSAPATRELVAEFIFRAIHPDVETVHYVPAAGIYRDEGSSLGEQVFDLALDPNSADAWGRPSDTWYANDGKYNTDAETIYAVIEEEALATYTTAVAQCDVADETGVSGEVDAYVNGQETTVDINENATKATIGEQGRLTEVYEDCVVMIDTFLAQVTDVVSSETDGNGHLDRQALLELEVYNAYRNQSETVYLTQDTDYTYAEGDMLLVNAYTDNANSYSIAVTKQSVEGYVNQYDVANHLEVAQAAESFVGAQTEDWVNAHKHVIDGEEYMDAFRFSLDRTFNWTDENDETINYNWWLDQYGNIIGVTAIDRTGYAVLKDIIWTTGQAEATLVYMDGSEDTVVIDTIDGFNFANESWNRDNAIPVLRDDGPDNNFNTVNGEFRVQVSSDATNNTAYLGYALYEVYTNDDGTVELEGIRLGTNIIGYADVATIDVNKSTITTNNGNTVEARFDGSTQFIVNNGDGTYSAYTRDTLPTFAEDSLEVFWSLDGTYASSVYIKDSTLFAEDGTHLFTTTDSYFREVGSNVHVMDVIIDGAERTIRTVNPAVIETLENNEGKLFHVTFQTNATQPNYGFVTDVTLVNEYHDNDNSPAGSGNANCTCNYTFAVDVIAGDRTITIEDRDGTEESWNTTNATTIVNLDGTTVNYNIETIEQAVENLEVGIWVVEDENGAAAQIYIGTRLSTDAGLNVTSTTEDAKVSQDGNTYTVTLPEDVTSGNITVSATGKNAVLLTDGLPVAQPFTESKAAGSQRSFTVWAEDGVTNVTYTVEVVGTNNWADIFQNVTNKNDDTELVTGPVRGYKTVEMACANVVDLNTGSATTVHFNTYPANSIEWRVFTDTADAIGAGVEDYVGMTNNDIGEASLLNGNILMVEVGTSEGTFYTAFAITNPVN